MANCMTCRHNDKKAKYCPVKKAHTDLGYVLNCIAWAPTDGAEMKRFRAENAKLRELVHVLCHCMQIKASCDDCRINGHKGELAHDPLAACDGLHKMLRELGVDA